MRMHENVNFSELLLTNQLQTHPAMAGMQSIIHALSDLSADLSF